MKEEGIVSLWIGTADSSQHLEECVTPTYTEDGDRVPPPLAADFALDRFDDSFREASTAEEQRHSLAELLDGYSYSERIIPRFVAAFGDKIAPPANAVILLYNYHHPGPQVSRARKGVTMRFIGAVPYKK